MKQFFVDRRHLCLSIGGGAFALAAARAPALAGKGRPDLYRCEGCEAVHERAASEMQSLVQLSPPEEAGQPLVLTGRVLDAQGIGPAAGVIVYAHHTDANGLYSRGRPGTEWSLRHGLLRGWALTDREGRYGFTSIKPAPYPDRNMPAHIHLFIGEPGRRPYYIDDVVFAGEFGVTPAYAAKQELRGGSGIVRLRPKPGGGLLAVRDIRLERHTA